MNTHGTHRRRTGIAGLAGLALAGGLTLLAGCPSQSTTQTQSAPPPVARAAAFHGSVFGGRQPIVGATILAYAASTDAGPVEIGHATTESDGHFTISNFSPAPRTGQVIYIVAQGGISVTGGSPSSAIKLMTIAGIYCTGTSLCGFPNFVNITELTTVASTSVLHNYLGFVPCTSIPGNTITTAGATCVDLPTTAPAPLPDLGKLAATVNNLVNVVNGQKSQFLAQYSQTAGAPLRATLEKMDTLANVLAGCVNAADGPTDTSCTKLFQAVFGDTNNTLKAAWLIAAAPGADQEAAKIFNLSNATVYSPVLQAAPVPGTSPGFWTIGGVRHAYVALPNPNAVGVLRIGPPNGLLENTYQHGTYAGWMAVGPQGHRVYSADVSNLGDFDINVANGQGTYLGSVSLDKLNSSDRTTGIAVSRTGSYVYVGMEIGCTIIPDKCYPGYVQEFQVATDGSLTYLGGIGAGQEPRGVVADPTGPYLFVANSHCGHSSCTGEGTVYTYHINSDGSLTQVGSADGGIDPTGIAVDPTGHYLYVTNTSSGGVRNFTIGASGQLTYQGGIGAGTTPFKIAVDPTSQYVYVITATNQLLAYHIYNSSGDLELIDTYSTASEPDGVAVDPTGRYVLVCHDSVIGGSFSTVSSWAIGPGGTLTSTGANGDSNPGAQGIVAGPAGRFAFVTTEYDDNGTYKEYLDIFGIGLGTSGQGNGFPSPLGSYSTGNGSGPQSVALSSMGRYLYVANTNYSNIPAYLVAPNGSLTPIAGSPFSFPGGSGLWSIAVDPAGGHAYVANFNGDDVGEFAIAPANAATPGALSFIGTAPAGTSPQALAIGPPGPYHWLYAGNSGSDTVSGYSIDSSTGTLSPLWTVAEPSGFHPNAVAVSPNGGWFFVIGDSCDLGIWHNGGGPYVKGVPAGRVETVDGKAVPAANPCVYTSIAIDRSVGRPYIFITDGANANLLEDYFDPATGTVTQITSASIPSGYPVSVRVSPLGAFVYVTTQESGAATIDVFFTQGTLSFLGSYPIPTGF